MNHLKIPDYKEWTPGLYLIDAGCSAGKSTFVIKELYPFAKEQGKKILMFSNRLALKEQQEILAKDTEIVLMTYQKLEFNQYQQGMEVISQIPYQDLMSFVERFDYLVLDEAHYLFQDASFNLATEVIVKMVESYRNSKIILMMSATPQLLKEYYNDDFANAFTKTYNVERDYNYIKKLWAYKTREAVYKIIHDIPENEKIIFFGDNKKRLKQLCQDFEDSTYLESGNKSENPVYKQIVTQECFEPRILFTTKVFDNGVNLKDKTIKHIIIEMSDLVEFIQCLGRKRVLDDTDTVTVYFYAGVDSIAGKYGNLKNAMMVADDYYRMREHHLDAFLNKYRFRPDIPNFFDNTLRIVHPAYFKAHYDFIFYQEIVSKKSTSMIKEVEKLLDLQCDEYERVQRNYRLKLYLESNVGKRFFKSERKTVINAFHLTQNGTVLKSRNVLNQYLKDYNFEYRINAGKEKRKVYWVIERAA